MLDEYAFALCLTHDIDRPFKTYQAVYYALREDRSHLADVLPGRNPYWQFEDIMALEDDLGVRSAFYVLNEPHLLAKGPRAWLNPADWVQHLGRYDVEARSLGRTLRALETNDWEVGLHGSYRSYDDRDRLSHEKQVLEDRLERPVVGGRQHYLNLSIPETWRHHAAIGLRYDASLGSRESCGFRFGYRPRRPFDDDFVVFPLTVMDQALPDPGRDFEAAWETCTALLEEAARNGAVMSVLWHPRFFSDEDFPGYSRLYRRLIERAQELGAWVGTPAACYRKLDLASDCGGDGRPVRRC